MQLANVVVMAEHTSDVSELEDVSDAALASRAQTGDTVALSTLLQRHAALVERVAKRVMGNADLVDDVLQDSALAAFLNVRSLLSPERFSGWYCGIVMNHCRMHLRKRARLPEIHSLNGSQFVIARGPDTIAEERLMLSEVIEALQALPEKQRRAALLVYFEGLTQKEAAAALGISVGALKARLHRAREAIRLKVDREPTRAATRRRPQMVEVEVYDVFTMKGEEAVSTAVQATVLLREKGEGRMIAIWMGESEGVAMAYALEDKELPRPMTHDLTKNLLDAVGVSVQSVTINKLVKETFYAVVSVRNGSGPKDVDARPSDAINLAIRAGAPLFVEDSVFDESPAIVRPAKPERTGSAAIVSPSDESATASSKAGQKSARERIMKAWKELGIEFEDE